MKLTLLFYFLPILCLAQSFGVQNVAFLGGVSINGPVDIPSAIAPPIFRWKRADLTGTQTLNSNIVYWLDEVVAKPWSQTTTANQPTNAINGVHFNGSQFMSITNTAITFRYESNEVFVVLNIDTFPAQSCFLGYSGVGGFGQGFDSSGHFIDTHTGALLAQSGVPTGTNVDFICSQDNSTGASTVNTWTNGVAARVSLNQSGEDFSLDNLGCNQAGAAQLYKGFLQEVIFWYNTNFNASAVSNLHYYRTNVYGGWP